MNIYLLRHGETEENKNKFYYGKLNVSLNEKGRLQSQGAGVLLKGINFDKIYISERKRTKETVEIALNNNSPLAAVVDGRINELDFGKFEGKSYKDIQKEFPKEYEQWNKEWKSFTPPGGESYEQFYARIKSFMEELLLEKHENVLVVTHGGVVRSILCFVLGENLDLYWKFASRNGDVTLIKYEYGNLFIDSITHV